MSGLRYAKRILDIEMSGKTGLVTVGSGVESRYPDAGFTLRKLVAPLNQQG